MPIRQRSRPNRVPKPQRSHLNPRPRLTPPKYPRMGKALPLESAPPTNTRHIHGADGLGNAKLDISRLQHEHTSDKVICDVVRAEPEEITIICLGPLTNIARAIKRDPELGTMIGQLMIMGGSMNCIGNETPAAEFNVYYDPESAREVFDSLSTKTVIPICTRLLCVAAIGCSRTRETGNSRISPSLRDSCTRAIRPPPCSSITTATVCSMCF